MNRMRTNVRVVHGANEGLFDLHGRTVGIVRKSLREVFNIPENAIASIGGRSVADEQVLCDGDVLEFNCEHGTKGLGALLTSDELKAQWGLSDDEYEELLIQGLPSIQFSSGSVRHPEVAVDEFMRQFGDVNKAKPPELVGTPYVAERLGCTTVWVTDLIRNGNIPVGCIAPGTGNGKPWKFFRVRIEEWLKRR